MDHNVVDDKKNQLKAPKAPYTGHFLSSAVSLCHNFHARKGSLIEQSLDICYYQGTRNSPVEGGQWDNHKPAFAIDNQVDHSQVVGNYRSKADIKPWFEIELTEPVEVAGLEVTTFGAEDNKRQTWTLLVRDSLCN